MAFSLCGWRRPVIGGVSVCRIRNHRSPAALSVIAQQLAGPVEKFCEINLW
jgi:hypothetical protein